MEKNQLRIRKMKYVIGIVLMFCCVLVVKIETKAAKSGAYTYQIQTNGTVTITKYSGKKSLVVIPDKIANKKVTVIGEWAFYGCNAKYIVIPNTVQTIEDYAFFSCELLKKISIPKSVKKINFPGLGYYDSAGGFVGPTVYCYKNSVAHKFVKNTYETYIGLKIISGKVKIKFNGNKGVVKKASKMIKAGNKYGSLPKATRKGYKFLGWFTHKTGGIKITKKSVEAFGYGHTLYARWQKK